MSKEAAKQAQAQKAAILHLDLTDEEYAQWFLSGKIVRGFQNPAYALNDFVLFRIAHDWPKGARWSLDEVDIASADFTLSDEMASDLVDFANEGLHDGYQLADWYARLAATWYVDQTKVMPEVLFLFFQRALFLPKEATRGRKRSGGIDRDRNIRNAVAGLRARGCGSERAQRIVAETLGMTADAIRKAVERTPRTAREARLTQAVFLRWSPKGNDVIPVSDP